MIILHRLNGVAFAINPDLVQRAEETPDTVLTLTDGTHMVVAESVEDVAHAMTKFKAMVMAQAWQIHRVDSAHRGLRVLPHDGN